MLEKTLEITVYRENTVTIAILALCESESTAKANLKLPDGQMTDVTTQFKTFAPSQRGTTCDPVVCRDWEKSCSYLNGPYPTNYFIFSIIVIYTFLYIGFSLLLIESMYRHT